MVRIVKKEVRSMDIKYFYLVAALLLSILFSAFVWADTAADITWYPMEEAQQLATQNDKKVLIFAEAEWCGYCKKMYKEVFPKQSVQDSLKKYYYPVRVDIESDEKIVFNGRKTTGRQFAREHRITGTPTTFFVQSDGTILGIQPGFIPADIFKKLLAYVGSGAHSKMEFEEYAGENR